MGNIWVAVDQWFNFNFKDNDWQGIAIILNPLLIFVAAAVLRAGRT